MKNLIFALFLLFFSFSLKAQYGYKVDKVDASAVPSDVKEAFSEDFSGVKVVRWEHHIATNKKNSYNKYVCIFDTSDKIRHRARYKEDGSGISATSYYWFKGGISKLPKGIHEYCQTNHPEFKIRAGEKEKSLVTGKSAYRIKLGKGVTKITVWLDESGNEIASKNVLKEWKESESENEQPN